jgi:ABC-type transport system involved in multi-copper enzyme maturation permease subunit
MKKKLWSIADLIDLEFFLNQDDGEDLDGLAARDRRIYTELPPAVKDADPAPAALLRAWLSSRRETLVREADEPVLPGRTWRETLCFFFGAALLVGLFSGGGLAFSFLTYAGKEPVNVAAYFAVFVLLEAVLFLLLAGSAFFRKMRGNSLVESSILYRMLRRLFTGLTNKLIAGVRKRTNAKVSAETRLKWSAHTNSVRQLRQRYGLLFLRPFFLVVQLFGVSFNAGVLAATLFKVIGADLAFGWQSTLQVTALSVHNLVRWISLPWSWLPDPLIPSLSQIEGSRLVLKDGIYHLLSADLTSWWPFLCLSVLCYGLLPRLALLLLGTVRQHLDLTRLDFQQACFRQPVHRMRTPQLSTAARFEHRFSSHPADPAGTVAPSTDEPAPLVQEIIPAKEADSGPPPPITALIPDELLADCSYTALREQVCGRFGYDLCQLVPFWGLEHSEEEELTALQAAMERHGCDDLLLLHEAWQPPIQELFTWLALLRHAVGPQPIIILALIGKPTPDTMLTPVRPQHFRIWKHKTAALGDPGLQLLELVK